MKASLGGSGVVDGLEVSAFTLPTDQPESDVAFRRSKARHLPLLQNAPGAAHDLDQLTSRLRERVSGEVRFDAGSRALYSTDASNYRQVPIGVVIPKSIDDVVNTIATCREQSVPILSRGGGTSLAGQCCNVAVVMDFSKYLRGILELDPDRRQARVLPGTVLDDLRNAAEKHALTFGPDPSTHNRNTLGGMIGNNSCGVHSVMAGRTVDNVDSLEIITYDGLRLRVGPTSDDELATIIREGGRRGEIYAGLRSIRDRFAPLIRSRFPKIPRLVSGYPLDQLLPENGFNVARALVGTESTCVTVLEATLRLVDSPRARTVVALGFKDVFAAGDAVPEVLEFGPIAVEGLDDRLIEYMRELGMHPDDLNMLPKGGGWLLVEFGGATRGESDDRARAMISAISKRPEAPACKLYDDPREELALWKVREGGLGATAHVRGGRDTWPGWEDSAVHPNAVGAYLRRLYALFLKYGFHPSIYGHFGDGCIHCSIGFDLQSADGIRQYRSFVEEAADLVVSMGGTLSGEHGDGQARGELLTKMFGSELVGAFREFKSLWDPTGRMNPGKVVDANPLDSDLRLYPNYRDKEVHTHFAYPNEGGFARAANRCAGIGLCRRESGGVMCPSYMVTREEQHSTRGRSRLLFEMLEGETIEGWHDEHVKDALDLCLACKGCKHDCPVSVDMATYKAEFLSHYYEGRMRPLSAYVFGMIDFWSRLAEPVPWLANFFTQNPFVSGIAKRIVGIPQERTLPPFATHSLRRQARARPPRHPNGPRVILWADTFNNYFHPEVGLAAIDVLEAVGFNVTVPGAPLCCGRPLYDFGMLGRAKRLLKNTLHTLRSEIEAGVPIVGLEPSCVAVFRDEMPQLLPDDPLAHRMTAQTHFFTEFLAREADAGLIPKLARKALVHGHCHHRSVLDFGAEEKVLERLGLDCSFPDSGCCGLAGSFGFEDRHYGVSMAAGERVLFPAVRETDSSALVITDGFSCREQIEHGTGRRPMHIAEVMKLALDSKG